nr:unnamed protein product [Spirometra erinaceieuropaei]
MANGYPRNFIERGRQARPGRRLVTEQPTIWRALPYLDGVSEAVSRLLRPLKIGIAHRPESTIRHLVLRPKARLPIALRAQLSKQMSRRAPRLNINPDMSESTADTHPTTPQPGSDEGAVLTTAGPSTSPADEKTDSRCGVNKIARLGRQLRSMEVRTTTTNVSTPASDVD